MVSCQKGPTCHAYAWQTGPFWQDTLVLCFAWLWWCLTSHGVACISMCFTYTSCITMYFAISLHHWHQWQQANSPLIAGFMVPTWGPAGADRTQLGPMLAPWTLLPGLLLLVKWPKKEMSKINWYWPIEAETKWPPFRRRHFQMHSLEWNCMNLNSNFFEICSWGSN